ncbi:TPA: hypothetical protein MJA79_25180 [Klebsiella pneumoniae]|nr:hypothetical protein [Klebsiella pneumoniae]HBY9748242.1 hypothetical protein [Klebsiella pneumoniae]HBY9753232.1 hypothetical protein [Klebsiella pneumoniae]HBY9758265.1 hypothetical protein [Klebsiella pneumoniae]
MVTISQVSDFYSDPVQKSQMSHFAASLPLGLTGNVGGVVKLFNRCGWQADSAQDTTLPHQFILVASRVA